MSSEIVVGRREEIARLRGCCRAVFERGEGSVVFLTGEAGIGKTTLGEHVAGLMRGSVPGLQYAHVECGDLSPWEQLRPFFSLFHEFSDANEQS